jgi:mono/diheme cytochrome c family protein
VPTTAEDRFYEPHVRNVLYNYCISCHADTADAAYAAYPLNGFPSGVGVYNETLNRVDLNDPEGSLLLAKMSNTSAVPHGGGEILKPGDVGYAWVLNWVRQGAVYDQASLGPRTFANHVQPILSAQCFGCHSGGTGGFTVASNANITAGYNEMLSVTTANDGPGSLIIRTNDGTDGHAGGAGWTVGTAERAVILQWITDGRLFQ